jgi:hypothetical protein
LLLLQVQSNRGRRRIGQSIGRIHAKDRERNLSAGGACDIHAIELPVPGDADVVCVEIQVGVEDVLLARAAAGRCGFAADVVAALAGVTGAADVVAAIAVAAGAASAGCGKRRRQALLTLLVFRRCEETGIARLVERGQRREREFFASYSLLVITPAWNALSSATSCLSSPPRLQAAPARSSSKTAVILEFARFRMFVSGFRVYRNTDSILQISS